MKIQYIEGDLFKTEHKVILHGCNDCGVQGSGVAKLVRELHPKAYSEYRKRYESVGLEGGTFIPVSSNGKIIINAITQHLYGRTGDRFVNYEWIYNIFENLDAWCDINMLDHVAMPLVGSALGGGNWNIISNIIEETSTNYQPVVYILPQGVATQ